jgi:hypothetical protein
VGPAAGLSIPETMKPRGMSWTDSSWVFLLVAVLVLFVRGLG